MLSYLRFLLQSTNQHGVHSPFVYNYVTKGLYQQNEFKYVQHKTNQWLLQSIQYFKPNSICFLNDGLSVIAWKVYTNKNVEITDADLILDRYEPENHTRIVQTIKKMSNSQLLLIACYTYPKSFLDELQKNADVIVMIDFYYGCLISKRTEQLKQNFRIRY